jgi:hypothetical protein
MGYKCTRCQNTKSILDFYRGQSHCKQCDNARKTKYCRRKSLELGKKQRTFTLDARELRNKGLKRCPKCKKIKNLKDDYNKSGNSNFGFASHCRACCVVLGKENYNPKARMAYYKRRKRQILNGTLKRKFGISLDEYEKLARQQKYKCKICSKNIRDNGKRLAVDHCHSTGEIRSLLCNNCNVVVGFLDDDPNLAEKIGKYIQYWSITDGVS